MNAELSVRKVAVKTDEGKEIVHETSFDLPLGTILGVYGPNGSGKSSLLRAMCGISNHENITGETWLENSLITREMQTAERIRSILYLGSDFISPFELTVRDLLEMGALVHSSDLWPSLTPGERAKMGTIIELLSLVDFLPRVVSTLSDGEKQLVMFARCLVQAPKVLVLDESFSKLDLDKLLLLTKVMRKLLPTGRTFIIASHDLNFLSEVSDQILFLKDAKTIALGPVSEVFTSTTLEQLYPNHAIHVVKSPETGKHKLLY